MLDKSSLNRSRSTTMRRGDNAENWAFYWYIINLKHLAEIVC